MKHQYSILSIVAMLTLSACSTFSVLDEVEKDNREKYQKATVLPPLKVPPDLTENNIRDEFAKHEDETLYVEGMTAKANPLTQKYQVIESKKPILLTNQVPYTLLVYGESTVIWQYIIDFWSTQSIDVKKYNKAMGLLDTHTDADNYAYRLYREQGEHNDQHILSISAINFNNDRTKNEAKLRQLAEYIGLQQRQHQQYTNSELVPVHSAVPADNQIKTMIVDEDNQHQALIIQASKAISWQALTKASNNKYLSVHDRSQSNYTYLVKYQDPFLLAQLEQRSFLSKMAFWQDEQDYAPELFFYIQVVEEGKESKMILKDLEQRRISSASARRLLRLLQVEVSR